jgi:hypothetical protein
MTRAVDLAACPNCGAPLEENYCPRCGQKAAPLNPSFGEFLHELVHEVAHVDGKIVQSTRLLLTRPGFLSREQFDGRRARYVSPIRLYLMFSVLYFGVAAFSPLTGPRVSCPQCPAETRAETEREMRAALGHRTPQAMFVLVPLLGGLIALTVGKSRRNYPQHLYFALHVHAVWFFAAAIAGAGALVTIPHAGYVISRAALLYAFVYFVLALRRTYGASYLRSVLGAAAVMFTYMIAVVLALFAILWPVVWQYRAH